MSTQSSSKKTHRVHVNLDGYDKTAGGHRKIWYTDKVHTYCCTSRPAFFVWEKSTQQNNYEPYIGYVDCKYIEDVKGRVGIK